MTGVLPAAAVVPERPERVRREVAAIITRPARPPGRVVPEITPARSGPVRGLERRG